MEWVRDVSEDWMMAYIHDLEAQLVEAEHETTSGVSLCRDALGRIVRDEWVKWAREQPNPKPSWLLPFDDLSEPDREVDRRIGERLAKIGAVISAAVRRGRTARDEEPYRVALNVAIFAKDDCGRLLLIRHRERCTWELPGGKAKRGETWQDAARRELREEAGITWICVLSGECCFTYSSGDAIYIVARAAIGNEAPAPGNDAIEACFFDRRHVANLPLSDLPTAVLIRAWERGEL